jgi:transposase-like protein
VDTGLIPVHIIAHLGSTDNEYLLEVEAFRPDGCPTCGGRRVHLHDEYLRQGQQMQVPVHRWRCARVRCRQVFSVLPSYLVPNQSYPAATQEVAVATYSAGAAPLEAVATMLGVGTTTVFRWVDRACSAIAAWFLTLQQVLLRINPAADVTVKLREDLRRVWRARRIRRPGKTAQLLLLDRWRPWVELLRLQLAAFEGDPAPDWLGPLAFWRQHMAILGRFATTESGKAHATRGW